MSNGHGNSRRQAYGRRMKDLRTRRQNEMAIDLEGPDGWSRGDQWDDDAGLPPTAIPMEPERPSVRSR